MPFGRILAATVDGKPVTQFPNIDEGFVQVVDAVARALDKLGGSAPAAMPGPAAERPSGPAIVGYTSSPRSSNLAVRTTFSDRERDQFRREGIEYLARFFENSLIELKKRNPGFDTDFHQRDANSFECVIYQNGSRACQCGIWRSSCGAGIGDICYSQSGISEASWNDSATVDDDGHMLGYRAMMSGYTMAGAQRDQLMTHEGLAEYFWDMLIRPLK